MTQENVYLLIMTATVGVLAVFFFYCVLSYEYWRHRKFVSEQKEYYRENIRKKAKEKARRDRLEKRRQEFMRSIKDSMQFILDQQKNNTEQPQGKPAKK